MAQPITTGLHRIRPSQFVRTVARTKTTALTSIVAAFIIAAFIAGMTVNSAFYLAIPAFLLVIVPAVISMIFFYYALSPTAAMLTLPHRLAFSDDTVDIDFFDPEVKHEDDINLQEVSPRHSSTHSTSTLQAQLLTTEILITSADKPDKIVAIVPFDTFKSSENLASAMLCLNIKTTDNIEL